MKHNNLGIHGATPLEMLHWIQLGQFAYTRENIFNQTGKGKFGLALNSLGTQMGWLLQRQSNKEFPRTKFTNGVMKGKLMGHEHTGLMLILAATVRSTAGRNLLIGGAKGTTTQAAFFPHPTWVSDWLLLLETQLQLEQWLKKDTVSVEEVKRMRKKAKEY